MLNIQRLANNLTRFRRDERGTNAIEFCMVAPFLLATWFGFYAFVDSESTSTKVGKVTTTVSDIIAQSPVVNREVIDGSFRAAEAIMGSKHAPMLELMAVGVQINNNGSTEVVWARGRNLSRMSLPGKGSSFPLDAGLRSNRGFVVLAKAKLVYNPIFGKTFTGPIDMEYQNIFAPRVSTTTECTNCPGY
ncbi:MAG: TadE/TadG family type IV pilus assembly protein [Pseudomonadota bacterium]